MNTEIISKIVERDRVFGKLCSEAQESYEHENYFSALVCLFIITEQAIKFIVESQFMDFEKEVLGDKGKYWALWKYIKFASDGKLITEDENKIVSSLIECRNSIFHGELYSSGYEIEGKFCSFSEDETLQLIYEEFSPRILQLIFRLVTFRY